MEADVGLSFHTELSHLWSRTKMAAGYRTRVAMIAARSGRLVQGRHPRVCGAVQGLVLGGGDQIAVTFGGPWRSIFSACCLAGFRWGRR